MSSFFTSFMAFVVDTLVSPPLTSGLVEFYPLTPELVEFRPSLTRGEGKMLRGAGCTSSFRPSPSVMGEAGWG